MDYPQLNFLFGVALIFTLVVSISLRILLTKTHLPVGLSLLSSAVIALNVFSALYIGILLLRSMMPSFIWQLGLAMLVIGGIGTVMTAALYRKKISARSTVFLFAIQMLMSLANLAIALGLYRSLTPL